MPSCCKPANEVMECLNCFVTAEHIKTAQLTAIGALRDAVLMYFDWDKKDYARIPVREQVEVASLIGDVAEGPDGKPSRFTDSSSQTLVGWTVGAGDEYMINNNLTLRVEYLYVNLGHFSGADSVAVSSGAASPSSFTANYSDVSFNVVRGGANWKF